MESAVSFAPLRPADFVNFAGRGRAGQGLLWAGRGGAGQPDFPRGRAGWGVHPWTAHTKQSLKSSSLQEMFYLYDDEDDYDYAGDIFGDNDEEEEDTYVEDEEDVEDCDEVT